MKLAPLEALHAEFASGKHGYIEGMLVIRNGYLVFERTYAHDYDRLFVGRGRATRSATGGRGPSWSPSTT